MSKVREHLASLNSSTDPDKIQVTVRACANLRGLAQACVRDKKIDSATSMMEFWCGFTRRFPLVDFIDVGPGKEEADNKIRGTFTHSLIYETR